MTAYEDYDPLDQINDAPIFPDYERRKCQICNEIFIGAVIDDPICDDCFYEEI